MVLAVDLPATWMMDQFFPQPPDLTNLDADKRNFYKDLIVVIACLVVGVSCFLSLECVIKVTRKELLEWSNILLPFFLMHIFCNLSKLLPTCVLG